MNQDNFLLEALKMRSLLDELKSNVYIPKENKLPKNNKEYQNKVIKCLDKDKLKKPVLVGFREWIFSDKSG